VSNLNVDVVTKLLDWLSCQYMSYV